MSDDRLRIGVSACLAGEQVRFDGGHKQDEFVASLGAFADLVAVCPEMEIGLGAPRESMRLVRREDRIALVAPRTGRELTAEMLAYGQRKADEIAALDLDGFVVKKDSPSCGMERVRIYGDSGIPERSGRGLFTAALLAALPLLPVEEEGRLRDAALRENFLTRTRLFHRARRLLAGEWRIADVIAIHATVKLELLAHSPVAYRALGRLIARAAQLPREELATSYLEGLMEALAIVPSRGRHVNVLQHVAGYFSRGVTSDERQEIRELIAEYEEDRAPRSTPLTLLRHHARRSGNAYLLQQAYLQRGV